MIPPNGAKRQRRYPPRESRARHERNCPRKSLCRCHALAGARHINGNRITYSRAPRNGPQRDREVRPMTLLSEHVFVAPGVARGARQLAATVERVATLDTRAIGAMFGLYDSYYDASSRALFEADLGNKHFVVMLREPSGALAGFSTLAVLEAEIGGTRLRAIYSGDTIIDYAHWGTQALAFTWIRFAGSIKAWAPQLPLYWFLIVKGHRTYRYLSAFSIDFHPHWQAPTPAPTREIMDALASHRFGCAYDATRGVVSFAQSRGHLRSEWALVEPEEAARPDVAFFLRSNPGYVSGDELVCLAELASGNLRPLARRVFEQGLRA